MNMLAISMVGRFRNILTEDGRKYASGTYGLGGTVYVPRTSICR